MTAVFSPINAGPVLDVEVGMPVVDAAGRELGRVEEVCMSDPEAETTEGNRFVSLGGWLANLARAFNSDDEQIEPHVHEPLRTRLIRTGYLKLAGARLLHHERYVRADRIARVHAGKVELTVSDEQVDREV